MGVVVIPKEALQEKANTFLQFDVFNDGVELAELLKKVALELIHLLNTGALDARLKAEERLEYVRQSILVALDDVEKVGTKLLEESIAIEKTKDALKRIEEARSFVKTQLPQMLDLSLAAEEAVADGRLELREVSQIAGKVVQVARNVDWTVLSNFFGLLSLCCSKKSVKAEEPVLIRRQNTLPPQLPTPQSPLSQPPVVPEPQEVPPLPLSSANLPPIDEKEPESDEPDHRP